MRSPANPNQTQGERKDVIKRQSRDVVDIAHLANAFECRCEPAFCLKDGRDDVAMGQYRAFRQTRCAAGVLQERDRIQRASRWPDF